MIERPLMITLVREGEPVGGLGLDAARDRVKEGLGSLPWDGLQAFARGTGDPHPHDLSRETLGAATGETGNVTELLARAVTALGGSERHGQIEMAEAVAHAFDSGEHLAVQAGTGTGKSLAYLVPAIARAVETDEPVVVSTATIALQRQLVNRDLPRLAESLADVLPRSPEFALLKGRGNYLCLNKIHNGLGIESRTSSRRRSSSSRSLHLRSAVTCSV